MYTYTHVQGERERGRERERDGGRERKSHAFVPILTYELPSLRPKTQAHLSHKST